MTEPLQRFATLIRRAADDPEVREGDLRYIIRDTATLLEKQSALFEKVRRDYRRSAAAYGTMAIGWLVLTAFLVVQAVGWLKPCP